MALPTFSDLVTYVNKKITGNDWNTNWQKVINWLTGGNTDIKIKNLEISSTGRIQNNGTLNQNGNMTVEGDIISNGTISANGFTGDGSGLTNLTISAEVVYTPFCVNSGNVDSDGNGDLMKYTADSPSNLVIKFKVGDVDGTVYPDLVRTTAEGHTDTGNNIYDLDMSSYTATGTRIIYIQQETIQPTVSVIGATLYRQPKEPTGVVDGDIWLDTSREKMTSYIRTSSEWEKSYIVPLGTVTMGTLSSDPVIKSCTTFQYNQNGKVVTMESRYLLPKYDAGVTKTWDTLYEAESSGWLYACIRTKSNEAALTINSTEVVFKANIWGDNHYINSCFVPVNKGDKYKGTGATDSQELTFYPSRREDI